MRKSAYFFPAILFVIGMVFFSGCATSDVNYVKKSSVVLKRVPTEDVFVSEVHSYEEGGGLVVYGKVKRTADNCCDSARGHVDIAVVAADGTVIDIVDVG